MNVADWVTIVTAIAVSASAIATATIALATMRYARGTNDLAKATGEGTKTQAEAAQALVSANENIAQMSVRAHVVSSTRMAWVDAVRDAVAELLSIDAAVKGSNADKLEKEFFDNLIQRRLMIRYRIEFRLDPEKAVHANLLENIDALLAAPTHAQSMVKQVRDLTVEISEFEWRRVRREVGASVSADGLAHPDVETS